MTDIVERMTEWLAAQRDPRGRTFHPLHPETLISLGATEIDRLREVLKFIVAYSDCHEAARDAARQALGWGE